MSSILIARSTDPPVVQLNIVHAEIKMAAQAHSILDRLIAQAIKKPTAQRLKELEALLENGKLTIPQIKQVQEECFELRKRLGLKK